MAPPLPASPRVVGKIAGAMTLAFTSAHAPGAMAQASSQAPVPQRPSLPAPAPAPPQATPSPGPAPAPGPAPGPTPSPDPGPVPAPAPAPADGPAQSSWDDPGAGAPAAADTAPTDVMWDEGPVVDADELPSVPAENPASEAEASGDLFRASDKRFFFQIFTGASAPLLGAAAGESDGSQQMSTQVELVIGGHSKTKPELGAAFVFERGGIGGVYGHFNLGGRLQWDKALSPTHAVYSSTAVTLAFRTMTYGQYGLFDGSFGYFGGSLKGSWGITAIVGERLSLHFRPANLEIAGPHVDSDVELNWSIMAGMGSVW